MFRVYLLILVITITTIKSVAYSSSLLDRFNFDSNFSYSYSYSLINSDSIFNVGNYLDISSSRVMVDMFPVIKYNNDKFYFTGNFYLSHDDDENIYAETNELYVVMYNNDETSSFTLGERREVWGNGIRWNPANIISHELFYDIRRQRDKSFEAQKGRLMLKYFSLFSDYAISLYLFPQLIDIRQSHEDGIEVAFKCSGLIKNIETNMAFIQTMSGGDQQSKKSDLSFWASYTFPYNLTLFGDQLISFQNRFIYPVDSSLNENTDRINEITYSTLLGASYRWNETVLRGEMYYNGFGYDSNERSDYINGINLLYQQSQYSDANKWLNQYEQYLLSKTFIGLTIIQVNLLPDLDMQFQLVYGLEDSSFPASLTFTYHLSGHIDFTANVEINTGIDDDAEFNQQVTNSQLLMGVVWHY